MYIHHAKNFVNGINYEDTGYIYNPHYPSLGPKTYPPVFPLILAPVYKWFGLDVSAMKILAISFFLIFLLVFFLIVRDELSFRFQIILIGVIGCNPYFWGFKDEIRPDIIYLLFCYISLLIISRVLEQNKFQNHHLLYAVLAGIFIYLSYGTRSVGLGLMVSLIIYELIKWRKPTLFTGIAMLIFFSLMGLQIIFFHSDKSYLDQLVVYPNRLLSNLSYYLRKFSDLWDNGYSRDLSKVFSVILLIAASIGFWVRIRSRKTIFEIFFIVHFVIIILWPIRQGVRFLIPVIPLYFFYAFLGMQRIANFKNEKMNKIPYIIILILISVFYTCKYSTTDYASLADGVHKKESMDLFSFIRDNTKQKDVFVFRKPRVLSLYTGRSAAVYHRPENESELLDYLVKIDANYIVESFINHKIDYEFFHEFVSRNKYRWEMIYSNPDFKVYRIR